jgi:hypothetical protein
MHPILQKSLTCVLAWIEVVKRQIVSFLQFMRLVGDDGHWDWTTAALVAVLFVLVVKTDNPSLAELGAFFLALVARAHKKFLSVKLHDKEVGDNAHVLKAVEAIKIESKKAVDTANTIAAEAASKLAEINTRLGLEDMNPWNRNGR